MTNEATEREEGEGGGRRGMEIREFEAALREVLTGDEGCLEEVAEVVSSVSTFEESGVMTRNRGLVVTFADGSEYQLTLVRSR